MSKPINPNITAPFPKINIFLNITVRNTHFINVCDAIKSENHVLQSTQSNVFTVLNSQSVGYSKSILALHLRKQCVAIFFILGILEVEPAVHELAEDELDVAMFL